MTTVLSALQALGLGAVLVGLALALPLWGALVADGALVLIAATVVESLVSRPLRAQQNRRSGTTKAGAA